MEMLDVMRAPLVPIGSLAIWTMISLPSWRTVSILGGALRPPRPRPLRPFALGSPSVSPVSSVLSK